MNYPVICKTTHRYTYNKKTKKKDLYILVLRYSEILQRYQSILIESNGKTYGRHYDRKLNITETDIQNTMVAERDIPKAVLNTVNECIKIDKMFNR